MFDDVINTRTRTICTYVHIRAEKYGKLRFKVPFTERDGFIARISRSVEILRGYRIIETNLANLHQFFLLQHLSAIAQLVNALFPRNKRLYVTRDVIPPRINRVRARLRVRWEISIAAFRPSVNRERNCER